MSRDSEYSKLTTEIADHQEYSVRVMLYSIMAVGGIVGAKENITESSVIGAGFIIVASLVYLIGAARKVFVLSAFLAVEHDDSHGFNWHVILPKLKGRFFAWFETQNIASIYFLISFSCLIIFLPVSPWYSTLLFLIQIGLAIVLFLIPARFSEYRTILQELRDGAPNWDI